MKNLQYEKWIIWFMIANEDTPKIIKQINIDYFTDTKLRDIFKSMEEINNRWLEVDFLTLNEYMLNNINWYTSEWWWILYLADLNNWASHLFLVDEIIKEMRELYKTRKLKLLYKDLENADIEQTIKIRAEIDKVLEECEPKEESESQMQKIIKQADENIALYKQKWLAWYSWWPSYKWLNDMTWWIRKGKTYRIAWMSWAWKTSFIYEILYNLLWQQAKVLFIEMESQDTIYYNLMSTIVWVNPRKIENWTIQADNEHILKFEKNLILFIDENNLDKIKLKIIETKPDVVILDYIWLVSIPWFDENSKYSEYADQIKMFVQNNQDICFIDLSNLPKSDNSEDMIRLNRWFNWSAKLRNNCDFWLHIFDHSWFVKYKKEMLDMWEVKDLLSTKVMTFLISKNRFWPDWVERNYKINFNCWVRFEEVSDIELEKYNSYK